MVPPPPPQPALVVQGDQGSLPEVSSDIQVNVPNTMSSEDRHCAEQPGGEDASPALRRLESSWAADITDTHGLPSPVLAAWGQEASHNNCVMRQLNAEVKKEGFQIQWPWFES